MSDMNERSGETYGEVISQLLPHSKMYKIQLGSELFRISGASLSSDGPNCFTEFFSKSKDSEQVMFIDRSAEVFRKIYQHLQGYALPIKDEVEYTFLYSDAMFYHLPKLVSILVETEYFYTNVGGTTFKFPKKLFRRKGDFPNYFHMIANSQHLDISKFRDLSMKNMRPPSQIPPYIPRSAEYFSLLIDLLNGASLKLSDETRKSLIKECRYYMFLNLEQQLIKSKIVYNPLTQKEDILVELMDLAKKNVITPEINCFLQECSPEISQDCDRSDSSNSPSSKRLKLDSLAMSSTRRIDRFWAILGYKRPYLDEESRGLIFQVNSAECMIVINIDKKLIHLSITGESATQFESVFGPALQKCDISLKANKLKLPLDDNTKSEQFILPACLAICDLKVNGENCPCVNLLIPEMAKACGTKPLANTTIRQEPVVDYTNRTSISCSSGIKLHCTKSLWKIGVRNGKIMLLAVKAETYSGNREHSKTIEFL